VKKVIGIILTAILTQLCFTDDCRAATQDDGLVEIHFPVDVTTSYKERRRTSGTNVGINMTNFVPYNWESLLDGGLYDNDYGSSPIQLYTLEAGYKYNFALGSISLLAGFGMGTNNTNVNGISRSMTVMKYLGKVMYAMDNMFSEPYVAPYVAGSVWQMRVSEKEDITDGLADAINVGPGFEYSVGALIQLNWLEPDIASRALVDIGIENTYLDVFMSQHMRTQSSSVYSTATDFNFGAGLRLEF
jgi:hypothetical protein